MSNPPSGRGSTRGTRLNLPPPVQASSRGGRGARGGGVNPSLTSSSTDSSGGAGAKLPIGRGNVAGRGGQPTGPPPPLAKTTGRGVASLHALQGGRGSIQPEISVTSGMSKLSVDSGGDGSIGRGTVRGKRQLGGGEVLRTRPDNLDSKLGKSGNPVDLSSNYFTLKVKPDWNFYQYRVDFNIEEDRTFIKKRLVKQLKAKLPNYIFDGSMFYTIKLLEVESKPLILTTKIEDTDKKVDVTFKFIKILKSTDYSYLQVLNIILRKCMENLSLDLVGRNYYDSKSKKVIDKFNLELWPGYITSIRRHEQDILMCCEISHKIIRTDTVYNIMKTTTSNSRGDGKSEVAKVLIGSVFMTRYNNNKTYKIDEVCWDKSPKSKFTTPKGEISLIQYYKDKYNITIKDIHQPLLISLPKEKDRRSENAPKELLFIPELCYMTGLTESQKSDFHLMKEIGTYTRLDPQKRYQSLMQYSSRLTKEPKIMKELTDWSMEFDKDIKSFKGRLLPPETIIQGQNKKYTYTAENADWGNAFRDFKLFQTIKCDNWYVLYPNMLSRETQEFIQSLGKVSGGMGFIVSKPKFVELKDSRTSTYTSELNKILLNNPSLVMIVVPNNKGDAYSALKKICIVETPVISQVMTGTILKKPKGIMSVATKVAIQMATKLGAEPWSVAMPIQDTMIIGYDSYHDANDKSKAIGAVVATINGTMTRFYSSIALHRNNEELLNELGACIMNALVKYKEINKKFPSRVLIYRDGVGDGQIPAVKAHEIPAIKKALEKSGLCTPMFAYIIVSKKISSQFYLKIPKGFINPSSGTVIDDVVTLPERHDFFLVSQSVRQGTVSPTSYNIIENTCKLSTDHIQRLTYKLTHLYFNWPGTVMVPSVCQYAHKLAYLVGDSIHKNPHPNLNSLLYYL